MSQVELYQSVLLKLGQLSGKELAALDSYLTLLTKGNKTQTPANKGIAHLAGTWKNWEDRDFEDFLHITQQIRQDLFAPRQSSL